ncbi:MAG TPA: MFS transporter [Burkholderiales bacterium]|jgi:nitrate/nitrite transporter NarK|nr:MFS transporter [Burkholderiales bacterium]
MQAIGDSHVTGARPRDATITVSLVVICQGFNMLTVGGIALFLPLIREDLGMSFAQAGLLSAVSTFTYALGQIPAGVLADRFGSKRLFFLGILGSTLLSFNFGTLHTYSGAIANQVASGAFRALIFAPGLTLVASWFPSDRRATAMGVYVIGGVSGNILLSLVGPLLAVRYGWRPTFMGFALLGVCIAFVYLALGREKPAKAARHTVGILDALELFRYPIMWVCAGIQFIRFGVTTSFNFWLPSLLVSDRGLSLEAAGLVTAMGAVLTASANPLGGYVSDRLRNPPLVIGASLAVLACTSGLLVVIDSIPLLVLVIAVNSIFLQFYFGPLFSVPMEVLGPRVAGMSAGFSNMFANFGALTFAYALGVVKDTSGAFKWGFIATGAVCVLGVGLSALLARMRQRSPQ